MFRKLFLALLFIVTVLNATVTTEKDITKYYIATFDRAPDSAGLNYWLYSGFTLEQIAMSFFDQAETQEKYPPGFSNGDFINAVYTNLFRRTPDSAGFEYWLEALERGDISRDVFLLAIVNGAQGDDAAILDNKTTVGLAFARDGRNNINEAYAIMKEITADPQSVIDTLNKYGLSMGIGSDGFTGSVFSYILTGLSDGMLSTVGGDIMGNFLSLLGWGDSGNSDEINELKDIDNKLSQISSELVTIENELQVILTDIKVSEDSIKNDVDWPRDAINNIDTATQVLQELGVEADGTKIKPGEGNLTKIANLASDILGTKYDIPLQVMAIYNSIEGNPTPLLSNYVDQVMLQLAYNDDTHLQQAYQGFEYYTSQLLNYQIKGVNLVVEAYKAQDDNNSAQGYFNCYSSSVPNTSECNILYEEIGDMDNTTSFIYNAVSLVLKDAPIYDPFLPASAESILGRAEFYRLLMTGTDGDKFGLRLFHITTGDTGNPPTYYASKPGLEVMCTSARHTVTGRAYDFWTGNTVKQSTEYTVTEYYCPVPNGEYSIFSDPEKPLGNVTVSQYDTNYDLNSSGTISYGFGIFTNNIPNHFIESSNKWSIQKPSSDNYYSWTSGSANSWPIQADASSGPDYGNGDYESNARIELDGHFDYAAGEEERTIYVDYHAQFYVNADAPFSNARGGGNAYSYYYVGVYDQTANDFASSDCTNKTYYRLHASSTHNYSETDDVSDVCSFTAKPGHSYYIYFNMVANTLSPNYDTVAESKLNTVYRVYIMFTY